MWQIVLKNFSDLILPVKYDLIIVGGGIVGLATALKFLETHPTKKLLLIEKENRLAQHQSGHNSGVIHSGIYYNPGSLKAVNCRRGYELLLQFCREQSIPHEVCGKIIVATEQRQHVALRHLYERGIQNGLEGLKQLSADELKAVEPHVNGTRGLLVPQAGIVDYGAVSQCFAKNAKDKGLEINRGEKVHAISQKNDGVEIITDKKTYQSHCLVCCAGLFSDRMAKKTSPNLSLRIIPFRGEYYKLRETKRSLVKNLIYPVPDPRFPFLGVHFTRMINGEVEAGPNAVLAFKREGYRKTDFSLRDTWETLTWPGFLRVAARYWKTGCGEFYRSVSKDAFVKALQTLVPEIQKNDLLPGGSGVRAQACSSDGSLVDDFYIEDNGNVAHVCNAPSPAATSSLAIGENICKLISTKIGYYSGD